MGNNTVRPLAKRNVCLSLVQAGTGEVLCEHAEFNRRMSPALFFCVLQWIYLSDYRFVVAIITGNKTMYLRKKTREEEGGEEEGGEGEKTIAEWDFADGEEVAVVIRRKR